MTAGWTVRTLRERGLDLQAICQNGACRKFFNIDLEVIAQAIGADGVLPDADGEACPACRGALRIVVALPDAPRTS